MVSWALLNIRRKMHWYLLIYKAILGYLPPYLCCLSKQKLPGNYSLHSVSIHNLCVPFARIELGKTSLKYAAALKSSPEMKLNNLVSCSQLEIFREM